MNAPTLKTLRILTFLLFVFLVIASFAGGFLEETYSRDHVSMAAQGAGQDLVDLFLVAPLLLVSFFYSSKGKRIWTLIYAGTLSYIMYSFIIYCFGVHFNRYFLVYCATLSLSLYAFILVITVLKKQEIEVWFENAPVKLVSGYIFFVALVFYALWLKSIVPAIIGNDVPTDVADYDLLVNPVHVIDLVFALPALLIGAVLIWRKQRLGYLIASISLIFMILLTIALAAMVMLLVLRDISEDYTVSIVFGVLTITTLLISTLFFRKLKT